MPNLRSAIRRTANTRLGLAIAIALSIALAGCGVPGEPLPPLLEIPEKVHDLSAAQVGASIRLSWTKPLLTTEGTRPREFEKMEVYAAYLPSGSPLTNFESEAKVIVTIALGAGAETPVVKEIPLPPSLIGRKAVFAVKAINHRGKDAGFSNIASLEISDLPGTPTALDATVTETAIRLSWKPTTLSAFGGPSPGSEFEIFRVDTQAAQPSLLVGTTQDAFFDDTSFSLGHIYEYSVRGLVHAGESTATTPLSKTIRVEAKDVFPPAAPTNVRAVAAPGTIEISWSPNTEPDLAGYLVYRSTGGAYIKLTPEPLLIPVFSDKSIQSASHYTYRIRAVDQSGNESLPSEETTITSN